MGAQRALGRGARSADEVDAILGGLVDGIAHRLRGGRRVGRTVVLRLRFDDFTRVTPVAHPAAADGGDATHPRGGA